MRNGRITHGFILASFIASRSGSLLCLLPLLFCSRAQSTVDSTSLSLTSPTPTVGSIRSMTTLSTISSSFNATSSSSSARTEQTSSDIFSATTPSNDNGTHNDVVFNYYFLFLVVFGIIMAALLWWLQRQKRRRKELTRLNGQHALARDMEGWTSTRRFMHGRYARNHQAAFIRCEEGLDEYGEAPPLYQPKSEITKAKEPLEAAQIAASRVTIPLRTVSRDKIDRARPPEY